ncbi:ABC transporter substrate-binding protein [Cupriavidus plantarum]|uniref:ABC transporter substrate-binding protein n=1 Tax=Cupriavidus plantarum TaxID=942865 RepID=UPI001B0A2C0F|nr:ABC transporter substrate-binding protein [Cupriavidus plantarum]CAG2149911.1 hypothetical protein LMG26296_04609 [Cupriavidus plantarum]SMR86538.1 amino acid/amide ABC transporter substrate-binding protein, HAAT family [Cupriavidus plantarum]
MRPLPTPSTQHAPPGSAARRRALAVLAATGAGMAMPSRAQTASAAPGGRRQLVVVHLVSRAGAQADLARDYLAGAKVMFDAANASNAANAPNGGLHISHIARDADPDPRHALRQAIALVDNERADVLFGPGDGLLPALVQSSEIMRRGVQIVAPLSGLSLPAENVWYTRSDYQSELDAAVKQLRKYGLSGIALAVAPDFADGTLRKGTPWLARMEQDMATRAFELTGDVTESARLIAARKPGAVVIAGDTLAYGNLGRALAAQGWFGFLVGLSSVSPASAREILGARYAGGIVLTQVAPGPQESTLRVVKEHVARMKQYLDEPPSPATMAGYIGAAWLVRAAAGTRAAGAVELRRAMQSRVDVGDFLLDFTRGARGSQYVQLAVIGKDGAPQRA